ncbi:MAG: hypothetical protein NT006_11180 [Candidatus Aminicenantes bacterium]|nr:hypothetical protein [Candidatus Aminicenantes bacterium]
MRLFIPWAVSLASPSSSSDIEVAHPAVEEKGVRDAQERDLLAGDGQFEGLVGTVADEGDGDLGPLLAAELLHGVVARDGHRRFPVDVGDDVPRKNAQAPRRPAFDRRDNDDVVALFLDLHAHAEVLARVVLAHARKARGVQEIGVGVERVQGPLDRGDGQGLLLERLVIAIFEDAGDGTGLVQRGGPEVLVMRRHPDEDEPKQDEGDEALFHGLHVLTILSSAAPVVKADGGPPPIRFGAQGGLVL